MDETHRQFLFDIIKEIKHYYETPVVYLTKKDYSDQLFNTMCALRTALQRQDNDKIIDTIADYHLNWLHTVNEIENYKKLIDEIVREDVYQSVSYTIDALASRLKYFHRYMESNRSALSNSDQAYLTAESEIVEEMHRENTHLLLEKLKCFNAFVGDREFKVKLISTIEELSNWFDKMCDGLSIQVSKYVNINLPHLSSDLTKTLRQIVDELHTSRSPSAIKMIDDLKEKGKELCTMIRTTSMHNLEIRKVVEKINILEDRIKRLESEPTSAAVMALTHKKEYLERRLNSLDNLKTTIKSLHNLEDVELDHISEEEICTCTDFFTFRIFNHSLPLIERERLITELCFLWDFAIFGEKESRRSIISILSATHIKEEFTDDLGSFYIDEYSRKIYKIPDDDVLYQPNELNELVALTDDEHVYFYDECGRYFLDPKTRQRVYKAHGTASEYMMGSSGVLLKVKEERDGIIYYYDNYGRYFINKEGKYIYREADSLSEYESDGLGNLVRIRSRLDMFELLCAGDANVTEDFNYLKKTVGAAIRVSIADCIIHQPADPIKYLSTRLKKYRDNLELKEKRAANNEELNVQREIILAEERAAAERAAMEAALLAQGGSEASYDSNLLKYTPINPDDTVSVGSTK